MTTLYLVGTPIGNLEDITPRALEVLRNAPLIAAEDTRTARQLLTHFDIHTPVTSYYEQSKFTKLDRILDALKDGDVAVVSEAGMPGLSDPGYELVRAALAQNVNVVPIPGPSAILAALVGSGLPADRFYYLGFLPREPQKRRKLLRGVANETMTLIAFEAPHRLREALEDMEQILGERQIVVARELTKVYEEFKRGSIPEIRKYFDENPPRGEFTLVIEGLPERRGRAPSTEEWDDEKVRATVARLLKKGMSRTEAVKRVARMAKRERREVYRVAVRE